MLDQTTFVTYVIVVLGFVFIPGPATILTVARSASSGTKAGIATGLGIAVGDMFHTLMAIVGISAIIAASAVLFSLIKFAGALYLLYLGLQFFLSKQLPNVAEDSSPIAPAAAFLQAVTSEILNPKTAMFFLAFLPQFVRPELGAPLLQLFSLGMVFVVLGLLSTVVYAFGGSQISRAMRRRTGWRKIQNRIIGTIYCGLGIRLALEER